MTFRVGQKVVCVDVSPWRCASDKDDAPLTLNAIYTISCVIFDMVSIEEAYSHQLMSARRFRPIVENKSDISFTQGAPKDSEQFDNRRKVGVEV